MIKNLFKNNPIIAASGNKNLNTALESKAGSIIYMNGELNVLLSDDFKNICRRKPIFIHIDLLKGLNGDTEALKFLKRYINPFGIITTKSNVIRAAKKEGLITIQRIFLIDTKSFNNSLVAINENQPDAVEIMPSIAPSIVTKYKEQISIPIILGGLISKTEHITEAFKSGADAVSLSKTDLWNYSFDSMDKTP